MKKSFNINLGGRIFNIDEDAYGLLNNYLENLRKNFSGSEDSEEIVTDIEIRLGELCESRVSGSASRIVDRAMIDDFIERLGTPDTIANEVGCKNTTSAASNDSETKTENATDIPEMPWHAAQLLGKKYYRNTRRGLFGGVVSGLAEYTGWNVWLLRLLSIVLWHFTGIYFFIVYLAAWVLIPNAVTLTEFLRLRGAKPRTGESEDAAWKREYERASLELLSGYGYENKGCLNGCIIITIPILLCISGVVAFVITMFKELLHEIYGDAIPLDAEFLEAINNMWAEISKILLPFVVAIPVLLLLFHHFQKRGKLTPMKKWIKTTLIVVWLLITGIFMYAKFNKNVEAPFSVAPTGVRITRTGSSLADIEHNLALHRLNGIVAVPDAKSIHNYINDDQRGNGTRILWHCITSQNDSLLLPFVCESLSTENEVEWSIMPRDEWTEYINAPSFISEVKIVGSGSGDSELYCTIDTAGQTMVVDLSRCKNVDAVSVATNSIPGWQVDVVKEDTVSNSLPLSFALSLKVYRNDSMKDVALPNLLLHERVGDDVLSASVLYTAFCKSVKK
jgi:phage shock protein C